MKASFKNASMNKIYLHTQTLIYIYTLYTGFVPARIQNISSLKYISLSANEKVSYKLTKIKTTANRKLLFGILR